MFTAQENEAQGALTSPQALVTGWGRGDLVWSPGLTGVSALNLLRQRLVQAPALTYRCSVSWGKMHCFSEHQHSLCSFRWASTLVDRGCVGSGRSERHKERTLQGPVQVLCPQALLAGDPSSISAPQCLPSTRPLSVDSLRL